MQGNTSAAGRMAPDEGVREVIRGRRPMSRTVDAEGNLRLDTNLIVSAGAGSGKTSLLIERLIILIRSGIPVDQLVAITFTKKAAGELQERFFSRLLSVRTEMKEQIQVATDVSAWHLELERIESALQRSEEAFIGTIHSFCSRILRLAPTAAGLPSDFQQIEEADELTMRRWFWQDALAQAAESKNGHLELLRKMEVPDTALFQLFSTCVELEGVFMRPSGAKRPDVQPAFDALVSALKVLGPRLPVLVSPDPFTLAVERCLLLLDSTTEWKDVERVHLMQRLASTLKDKGEGSFDIKVTAWGKKATPQGSLAYALRDGKDESVEGKPLIELMRERVLPMLGQWQHWLHDNALAFAFPIVSAYREHRVRLGRLTYDDLLREAARVVRTKPSVRAALQARFARILVDEFQDTDPEQAALLFALCAEELHPTDWRRNRLVPGSLFVVGDDKQSIYRFRKADFQAFHTVCDAVATQGGLHLQLTTNFRSDARICEWVNQAIAPLFRGDEAPYQATWQDLEPFKGALHDEAPLMRLAVDKQQGGRSDMPRTVAEGRAIADIIQEAGTGHYGDWMVLVRNHTRVPILMRTLTDAGIPVALEGGKGDRVADTIAQVHDLLGCLANPSDSVSLVATLTGIWFGVSDADLAAYRRAGGQWLSCLADVPSLQDLPESILQAHAQLQSWKALIHAAPPLVVFEQILAESGIAGALNRRMDGNVAVGMLEMIGALIADMQQDGLTMTECVRELGRYREGELDLELFSDNVPYRDSVRIMTVHGSKGLQARWVVLADVSPNRDRDPERHVWREGPELLALSPVRTRPGRFGSTFLEPAHWTQAVDEERRYARAEEMRLLYVAATRAKERLVVCTHATEGKGTWDVLIPALEASQTPSRSIVPGHDERVPGFALRDSSEARGEEASTDPLNDPWMDPAPRIRMLARSNWSVRRPSDHERDGEAEKTEWPSSTDAEGGRGRRFGSIMHTLFEVLAAHRKKAPSTVELTELTTRVVGADGGLDDETRMQATRHLACFMDSQLWHALHGAERVLTEVPFTTRMVVEGEEILSSGIVDLAFRKGNEWTIVDYKTDRADEETILGRHASQVLDYVQAWSTLFEGTSVSGLIWSTALDKALTIPPSEEQQRGEA